MKRVFIRYSDGQYNLLEPSAYKFRSDMSQQEYEAWIAGNTIEIPDAEWDAYQSYLALDRYWYQRIQQLDTVIMDRADRARKLERAPGIHERMGGVQMTDAEFKQAQEENDPTPTNQA